MILIPMNLFKVNNQGRQGKAKFHEKYKNNKYYNSISII